MYRGCSIAIFDYQKGMYVGVCVCVKKKKKKEEEEEEDIAYKLCMYIYI